jgi:hypothetical protein
MANLLGQNIGTNYKGILNLDSTINTPLDATLRAVTDGEGDASPLELSTDAVSLGGATGANWDNTNKRLGIGTNAPFSLLTVAGQSSFYSVQSAGVGSDFFYSDINPNLTAGADNQVVSLLRLRDRGQGNTGGFTGTQRLSVLMENAGGGDFPFQLFSESGSLRIGYSAVATPTAKLEVRGQGTTSATTALLVQNNASANLLSVLDDGNVGIGTNTLSARLQVKGDGTNPIARFEDNSNVPMLRIENNFMRFGASTPFGSLQFPMSGTTFSANNNGTSLGFYSQFSIAASSDRFDFGFSGDTVANTAGTVSHLALVRNFAASAGSANYRPLSLNYTINNSGVQTGTATGIFLNATETNLNGMSHNLLDLQVGGVSRLKVTNTEVQIGSISGARLAVKGSGSTSATTSLLVQNSAGNSALTILDNLNSQFGGTVTSDGGFRSIAYFDSFQRVSLNNGLNTNPQNYLISGGVGRILLIDNSEGDFNRLQFGGTTSSFPSLKRNGTAIDVRLADDSNYALLNTGATFIKGSGTTSATTSLLVQNSAGTDLIRLNDLGLLQFGGTTNSFPAFKRVGSGLELKSADDTFNGEPIFTSFNIQVKNMFFGADALTFGYLGGTVGFKMSNVGASSFGVGVTEAPASAQLEVRSTTKGFLPPRMTTTQKNAISSPAAGLVVYDTDTNKLTCYNGTTWNDLF